MTQADLREPPARDRIAVVAVLVAALAIAVAGAVHMTAASASRRAQKPGDLASRVAAARLAATLEPWNAERVERSRVMQQWERGKRLLDAGDYNRAVDELSEAYARDVGNAELLALFRRAQDVQALETNRKAHLQHGHEGPGGTLRPEDIER